MYRKGLLNQLWHLSNQHTVSVIERFFVIYPVQRLLEAMTAEDPNALINLGALIPMQGGVLEKNPFLLMEDDTSPLESS